MNTRPIFIIGSPRSGTTLLRLVLDAHSGISCGPETSFLLDLQRILGPHWAHLSLYGFNETYWQRKIADFFATFQNDYAQRRGKVRWAEKTPHYTPQVGFLHTLFPDAQFVHLIRDGRDVVASHLKRWGRREAVRSILRWRSHVTVAQRFGAHVKPAQYYELRYEDLARQPETTLRGLLGFLQEDWEEGLLDYLNTPHDVMPTYGAQLARHRQNTGDTANIYASRIGAWRTELPWYLRLLFYRRAGNLLQALDYA